MQIRTVATKIKVFLNWFSQSFYDNSVLFHIVFIHVVAYGRMRLFINDFSILAPYVIENFKPFNVKFIAHYLLALKTI